MMQHMVMKHGDQFDSFYDHMSYPATLHRTSCTATNCGINGNYSASSGKLVQVNRNCFVSFFCNFFLDSLAETRNTGM